LQISDKRKLSKSLPRDPLQPGEGKKRKGKNMSFGTVEAL